MKKTIIFLVCVLAAALLCACGSKPQPTPTAEPTAVPTEAPKAVPPEVPAVDPEEKLTEETSPSADAHQLIYGSTTEISGDFAPDAWWTNNATDKMLRDFTTDYGTVVTDQGGAR